MKISDLSLGEFSAGDAKLIPDNSARELKNIVRKNGQLTRRDGIDFADSGLRQIIDTYGTLQGIWSWKPALRISNRNDLYYLVYYADRKADLFYYSSIDGWQKANLGISFGVNTELTIFASPDSLLISDGISSPSKIFLKEDGSINYDLLGLNAPLTKPTLSNAQYTDETDQSVFSEVGFVRVAYTFIDKNGIESNPSPISEAFNAQRFKYVDGVQQNFIRSIVISNITVNADDIESVNIYTQITKFSEGEDTATFSFSDNYPVKIDDNAFTLYVSGSNIDQISYENDVLNVADKITKTGDVIVTLTGDQLYSGNSKFKHLQPIKLKNVNPQTIIDKPVRLRLYNEGYKGCPASQRIPNFNVTHYNDSDDNNIDFIRMYDSDLTTLLNVFLVSRNSDDQYMEIIVKLSMNAGVTKDIYLAFTGGTGTQTRDRTNYTGGYGIELEGEFKSDSATAIKVFRNIDVMGANTKIVCYADSTADIGDVNLADSELGVSDYSKDLEYISSLNDFPIQYLYNLSDIGAVSLNDEYYNYIKIASDDKVTSPNSASIYGRFNLRVNTTNSFFTRNLFVTHTSESGSNRTLKIQFDADTNPTEALNMRIKLDTDYGDNGTTYIIKTYRDISQYLIQDPAYTMPSKKIFSFFIVWTYEQTNDNYEHHIFYLYPTYNNSDGVFIYDGMLSVRENSKLIAGVAYGENSVNTMAVVQTGYTQNLFLENSDNNKEAIRNFANYMPLYLTDVVGRKFGNQDGERNSNFSLSDQIDFDNLGNYDNYIIRWSDKSGENFSDLNYERLDGKGTALIPMKGFYNNQYAPTVLAFTKNSISRLVIDDVTNTKVGANKFVGEQSGYGCDGIYFIAKYGDIVYWYSGAKNHCYMYNGDGIENISLGKVEFTSPTKVFINNATRQLIVVDSDKQYIYSLEYNEWYSATGLQVISATDIGDGKSLVNIPTTSGQNALFKYPSDTPTTEETLLKTKQYATGGNLIDRAMIDYGGSDVDLAIDTEYKNNSDTISYSSITAFQSYGITRRAGFLFFTLTGIDRFTSISADIRRF